MKIAAALAIVVTLMVDNVGAFSISMTADSDVSRRSFVTKVVGSTAAAAVVIGGNVAFPVPATAAAPEIFNTEDGVKYAVLKQPAKKGYPPQKGDIVAIEYTGYLANGKIFDATHAEGKSNVLFFKLGTDVVIDGLTSMVSEMVVGQKVQAIIPPKLAFGDKGLCLDDGECLIKPGSTLVYDIYLKKTAIPPP